MKALSFMDRLYRPKLFRFVLLLCFLANLGFLEAILDSSLQSPTKTKGLPIEQEMENEKTLVNFIREKTRLAREKDAESAYSPYDYFGDLQEISDMKKELGISITTDPASQEMFSLARKSIKKGLFTDYDISVASEGYKDHVDPMRESREEFHEAIRKAGWSGVLCFLLLIYLKNLDLAFVLFLMWIKEDREIFSLRNPFGFVLALIMYPVVMTCVFWQWMKHAEQRIHLEAELRRTKKKLFTVLSDDEVARIRRLVKSGLPASAWRRQLAGQGLVFRHSLALALLVTIIMVIIPRPGESRTWNLSRAGPFFMAEQELGHNLARMQIDEGQDDEHGGGFHDFLVSGFQEAILLPVQLLRLVEEVFSVEEIPKDIDHIPRRLFGLRPVLAAN